MVSSEYERRIAARFATFDQDGNGYIDREDFSAAAKALLAEFGTPARSDKGQALYIGAEAFWQGMAGIADRDGDQRITREEFVTGAVKRLRDNPDRFAGIARPFLHAARLAFTHPRDHRRMEFTAPLPDDLMSVLEELPGWKEKDE